MPFLRGALAFSPDAPALVLRERALTYWDLAEAAQDAARRLRRLGVGKGKVVALRAELVPETVVALHGLWMTGAAVAPLNARWTPDETSRALQALEPDLELPGPLAMDSLTPLTAPLPGLGEGEVAVRVVTSGTSGRPAAVSLTLANLLASARGARERLNLGPSDRWLGSLSPAHVGGVALLTRAALLGSGVVLRGSFDAPTFVDLAGSGTITHASLVPTMLHQVLDAWGRRPVPETLRCLLVGGAAAPEALLESALSRGFPVALTYGLTEACSQVATAPPSLTRRKPGTVGSPLPGVDVRIDGNGEILVRGATVAPGWVREDGWFPTGDLGRMDSEGHLWITGRISERIVTGGVTVDPAEVEAVLRTHPEVDDAAVTGIPDPEWGERVVAVLVSHGDSIRLEEEVDRMARAALSSPRRPRAYRVVLTLPRNANGKVDRKALRSLFR